jgi:hypothetical protein
LIRLLRTRMGVQRRAGEREKERIKEMVMLSETPVFT